MSGFTSYAIDCLEHDDSAAFWAADLVDRALINEVDAAFLIATIEPVIRRRNAPIAQRLRELEQKVTLLEAALEEERNQ